MSKASALKLIVDRAMLNSQHLGLVERADLFAAVAEIAPTEEVAEQARFIAFTLRTADDAQLKMSTLLDGGNGQ